MKAKQGEYDCLCGVYCIINALNLICKMSKADNQRLFKKLVNTLDNDACAVSALLYGTLQWQINAMLAVAIPYAERKCGVTIKVTKLFRRNQHVTLDTYWLGLQHFFCLPGKRVIIFGMYGKHDHWSCIHSITECDIMLTDSSGFKKLPRNTCRIGRKQYKTHYCLVPTEVWGLSIT